MLPCGLAYNNNKFCLAYNRYFASGHGVEDTPRTFSFLQRQGQGHCRWPHKSGKQLHESPIPICPSNLHCQKFCLFAYASFETLNFGFEKHWSRCWLHWLCFLWLWSFCFAYYSFWKTSCPFFLCAKHQTVALHLRTSMIDNNNLIIKDPFTQKYVLDRT